MRTWFAAALVVLVGCDGGAFVDRIVIVNDTDYSVDVDVRGRRDVWLDLATVRAQGTHEVEQVVDQGDTWVFRFQYARYDPVEVEINREQLVDAGWRVEVPPELEESLRARGVAPPP